MFACVIAYYDHRVTVRTGGTRPVLGVELAGEQMQRPAVDYPYHCETGCSLGRISWSGPYVRSPGQPMREVDDLHLVYVVRGVCEYEEEGGLKRRLTAGDMMVIVPGMRHRYGAAPGEEWDEQYLRCEGPLIHLWQREGLVSLGDSFWRLLPVDYWVQRMVDVIGQVDSPDPEESLAQLGRLQILLADMRVARRSQSPYPEDRLWLNQARRLLEVSEGQPRPELEVAAETLGCDYASFRRRFTQLAGVAPARYRLQSQIDLARSLIMRRLGISNKELASACGFADEYHFSKQFKHVMGRSPKAYRNQSARDS